MTRSYIYTVYHRLTGASNQGRQAVHFFLLIAVNGLTKLGDALSNAKVILPWVLAQAGAPAFFSGLLVPVRESGSLWPQLFMASVVSKYPRRKYFYIAGCLLQATSVAAMALTAWLFTGVLAGGLIVLSLFVFSVARSLCSVTAKDVMGKVIDKPQRGQVSGWSATVAGVIAMGVAVLFLFNILSHVSIAWVLLAASICWVIGALLYQMIREPKGDTDGSLSIAHALSMLSLLKTERDFRRFVWVRALLISSGLAAPFYVVLAHNASSKDQIMVVGGFMLASGIASMISGWLWGKLADRSAKQVLRYCAGGVGILLTLSALCLALFDLPVALLIGGFFVLSVLHQGVRIGRSTYVVNLGEGNQRTYFVSVSNTIIGVVLVIIGGLTAVLAQFSMLAVFSMLALLAWLSFILSRTMAEV